VARKCNRGVRFLIFPPGAGSSHPKVDPNFQLIPYNHLAFRFCETGSGINYFYAASGTTGKAECNMCLIAGRTCEVAEQELPEYDPHFQQNLYDCGGAYFSETPCQIWK